MRISAEGNLTKDPEIRFVGSDNVPCLSFSIAEDRLSGPQDGEQTKVVSFYNFTAWRSLAENMALTLKKGDRVVVEGNAVQRRWTDQASGQNRSNIEFTATSCGASLRWASAQLVKTAGAGVSTPAAEAEADAMAATPF